MQSGSAGLKTLPDASICTTKLRLHQPPHPQVVAPRQNSREIPSSHRILILEEAVIQQSCLKVRVYPQARPLYHRPSDRAAALRKPQEASILKINSSAVEETDPIAQVG